jgi:orotidine-5'-phosphate decarboxylase
MTAGATRFADRLVDAIERTGTPACVGLDPVFDRIPGAARAGTHSEADAVEAFCLGIVEAVAGMVPAIKPQSACFERYGAAGLRALERTCAAARRAGLIVILDAKRGDIGISAEHYAAAASRLGADAITVNAYLGPSTVEPYLEAGLGVFILVRTSNADSNAVQSLDLTDGRSVAELMADLTVVIGEDHVGHNAYSDVGAVVAATKPDDAARLRRRMAHTLFLVPGYGAQGGSLETVRPLLDAQGRGVLVTASRSVIYPPAMEDWKAQVASAATRFADEVRPLWRRDS